MVHHVQRQLTDLRDRPGAVGRVSRVTDVHDRLGGELIEDGTGHSEATDPTVENADTRSRHT